MARRAAIRNQQSLVLRASQRDIRLGRAALALPRGFVAAVSAVMLAAALVGVAGTVALAV